MNFEEWFKCKQVELFGDAHIPYWLKNAMKSAWNAALETQWQPIETAPKNRPLIVIADNTVQHIIVSFDGECWGDCSSFEILDDFCPTHWQPLPQPPKDKT